MTRWRRRVKEEGAEKLLQETIMSGLRSGQINEKDIKNVNVDTTVQTKAIRYPTDARLYNRMREVLVKHAKVEGIVLRQNYRFCGRKALIRQSNYGRTRKFKMSIKQTKKLKTYLGRVYRDIERNPKYIRPSLKKAMVLAKRILEQKREDKNKIYSIHEPHVQCIAKGKVHKKYEFGSKVGMVTTSLKNWIVGILPLEKNIYDGRTLSSSLKQVEALTGVAPNQAVVDLGYRNNQYIGTCKIEIVQRNRKNIKRSRCYWWKRRNAIEPIWGHLKADHRFENNRLKGSLGDSLNAFLSGCGFNLRKLLNAFSIQSKLNPVGLNAT
jgi:IS5 family transposase